MLKIKISGWQEPVYAGKRATLLDAALDAGVPLPFGCRSGECGSCKCRLVSGDVALDAYDSSVLTKQERSEGLILACRARPRGDVEIAPLGDLDQDVSVIPPRKLKAQVIAIETPVNDVRRVFLRPVEDPLPFRAGQYAELSFGKCTPRAYSMANAPGSNDLEFHVRVLPNGQASGYVAEQLKIGDIVQVDGPFGQAHFREKHDGPLLGVAGGTGIAPILSIVRTALEKNPDRQINLFFGLRSKAHVYAEETLADLSRQYRNLRTELVVSQAEGAGALRTGMLHEVVAAEMPSLTGFKVYAAGPPPMVDALTRTVTSLGLPMDHLHCDPFYASAPVMQKMGLMGRLKSLFS